MAVKRVTASYARGLPVTPRSRRTVRPSDSRATHAQPTPTLRTEDAVEANIELSTEALAEARAGVHPGLSPSQQQLADFSDFLTHETPPGDRIATVNYEAIVASAVANLKEHTVEARHAIYECARQVVTQRLNAIRPALPPELIRVEQLALDVVIQKIEAEELAKAAASAPAEQAAPVALEPVVVQEKPKLQHVQQFHGGAVRLLGVAAIVVAGVAGYWFAIGRPELPSPHALTQLLPAGQSQNQVQNQATSAPPDENAAADLPPPLESAPAAPLPDAQHSAFDAAPAGRLHTAAGTAVKPSDLTRLLPQCANTSDANERILCAQVAFALDDGWFADDNEQPKLPYWMTLSYRVAIATFLAREDASSENAASSSLASQHIEAGKALASAQELEGAVREFTEAIRIDPQSATAHVERGQVLFKHGNTESAVADFETAIKLDPQSAAAYKALGMAVHYLGNSDRAITNLSRAIEIAEADPSRLPVIDVFFSRRIRAALFNGKGRSDEELADLNWIINEYWTNAALRTALRENYGEDGVSGVIVHIYRARAVNLIARRNYDGATADISMAMQLDPRQTLALTILRARVLEMAGHREQAAADYKRALELSPTNDDVKSALTRLRKGGAQPSGTRPSTPAIPVD